MSLREKIVALEENYFKQKRPSKLRIGEVDGRIIYSDLPGCLFNQYDKETERIATLEEVIYLRVKSFEKLIENVPELEKVVAEIEKGCLSIEFEKLFDFVRTKALKELESDTYSIWKIRPTTCVQMVRAIDVDGIDKIFFYNGNPFDDKKDLSDAFLGELSDGGIKYGKEAIKKILDKTSNNCKMTYQDYIAAKGGNFTGVDWLEHPIFSKSIENEDLFEKYVYSMQVLNLFDFYQQGKHSGWRPGDMKPEYGRPISLGYSGDAFYPPNNSTLDHCMIILPKDTTVLE